MSASSAVDPIENAHRLGAEAFLVKPVAYDALMDVITRLRLPWALQGRWERDGDG
jgi:response regulator of citrate/malate metabolism